jgi:aminopeptidase N
MGYQLRSPVLWVAFIIFFLLVFLFVTTDFVQLGGVGNVHANSPFAIVQWTAAVTIFAQFAVVAFVANIVIRDGETKFGPILYSTRLKKFDYLFGRFSGAFVASMVVLASAPIALLIGMHMPWIDPERLGPLVPWHYIYAYFVVGVPTLFICASFFFTLATATRSMMASYVGLVAFLVVSTVLRIVLNRPEYREIGALLDPYGTSALLQDTRYWTASDRNTRLPELSGLFFTNRAIWIGLALASLAGAFAMFSFSERGRKNAKERVEKTPPPVLAAASVTKRDFGIGASWTQLLARARFEFGYLFTSPAFIVLMAIGLFNAGGSLWYADNIASNINTYPVTLLMVQALQGAFTIIPIIIATYYAGELVWRDRERNIHEIMDATPAPDWTFVTPKVVALTLVLAASIAISVVAGVLVQTIKGFSEYRLGEYVLWYAIPSLVDCFMIAALAVFVQAISPHKFVGWGLMLIYVVGVGTLATMGYDHNLYLFGSSPQIPLSEMNDQGHYWIGAWWFRAYWTLCALILVMLAYSLWRRGADTRLQPRLRALPRRLSGVAGASLAAMVLGFAGIGGWIYYNTNVLNDYRSNIATEQWQADMERALIGYLDAPQPKVTDVTLQVDLFPHEHRAVATGAYTIENRTAAPLSEIHLQWPEGLRLESVEIDGATLADDFATHEQAFPFQIWRLTSPMQPGERRQLRFSTVDEYLGFRTNNVLSQINDNGTFINDRAIAPLLGFSRGGLLQDPNRRRKYGLTPQLRMARLEDDSARAYNYLRHDSDWVMADITVSTVADQTPIAPGYVVSDETANGRRTTRFRTDAPILQFFSIQSANYEVRRGKWGDVDLAVYYDARHEYNVDRMISVMQRSFDVFTREFSPFQFRQMRILEFPAYATFAQSFANTVPYSEGIGFIARFDEAQAARETDRIDYVTYVTAHEVAHQWWAHQIIGGDMQGSTMLSETFASYSALLVMEELYGPDQVRRFLRYELDNYLRSRGADVLDEQPLMRVENQPHIHYRKGALVMYFLRNEIGEEAVNRSLQRLLTEFAFRGAPYPRSTDFMRILREEAGPEHAALITDLFERITLYDARVVEASTSQRSDGRWDVSMVVEARKLYADGKGVETEAPLDEAFEIGVFTAEPGRGAFATSDVVAFERRPIESGRQTVSFVVDREPRFVGIDPYNKRIDRNSDDNVMAVTRAASR